jgi:uncharacterized protein (TIGR00369 family)
MPGNEAHHRRLERMYHAAPTNAHFAPSLRVSDGEAEVRMAVRPDFFHAAGAAHGAYYFKVLDDAAFFAVASLEPEHFVLTAELTVEFLRPVSSGTMTARGRVTGQDGRRYTAEATVTDDDGQEIGRARGRFVRSRTKLSEEMGYV